MTITAPTNGNKLPRKLAYSFAGFYGLLFIIWSGLMVYRFLHPVLNRGGDWSNILIPSMLFICLILSSYFSGIRLGHKLQSQDSTTIQPIFISAITVSATLAITLLLVLGFGYFAYKSPIGLVFFAPIMVFIMFLLFSFLAHSFITWFWAFRNAPPA